MKAVIQRVQQATVTINEQPLSTISSGLLILIGVTHSDNKRDVIKLADKIIKLRIFNDHHKKMNLSVQDIDGEIMIVSQFTLYGNCVKGNRPSFKNSSSSEHAKKIYYEFVNYIKEKINKVQTGQFGADMQISLLNDGPVTFILDTNESK